MKKDRTRPDRRRRMEDPPGSAAPKAVRFSLAVFLIAWIVGFLMPESRTWGFHAAAYLPPIEVFVLSAIALLAFLPAIPARIGAAGGSFIQRLSSARKGIRILLLTAGALSCGFLFLHFAIPFSFLGDSWLFVADIYRAVTVGTVHIIGHAFLPTVLYTYLGSKLVPLFGITEIAVVFHWLGALLGAMYAAGLISFSRHAGRNGADRLLLASLFLSLGGNIFFFGYVEVYTPLFLTTLLFVFVLLRTVESRTTLLAAGSLLLLAVSTHLIGIFFLPAFLVLVWQRLLSGRGRSLSPRSLLISWLTGGLLFIVAYIIIVLFRIEPLAGSLIPFRREPWTGDYLLFSSYHLGDIVNELLLVSGIGIPLIAGLFRRRDLPVMLEDPGVQVFATMTISMLILLVFHFPFYGMARDWDIYAAAGTAIAMLAFTMYRKRGFAPAVRNSLAGMSLLWSLVMIIPWIQVNVHEQTALERYGDLLRIDEKHIHPDFAQYGYENLRKYYTHRGLHGDALRALRRMIELRGYPWDYGLVPPTYQLAYGAPNAADDVEAILGLLVRKSEDSLLLSIHQSRTKEDTTEYIADQWIRMHGEQFPSRGGGYQNSHFLALHPSFPQGYVVDVMGRSGGRYGEEKRRLYLELMHRFQGGGMGRKPLLSAYTNALISGAIANSYQVSGNTDSALVWYRKSYAANRTDVSMLNNFALALMRKEAYDSSLAVWDEAIVSDPSYGKSYLNQAYLYVHLKRDTARAISILKRGRSAVTDEQTRREIETQLSRLQAGGSRRRTGVDRERQSFRTQ